MTSSKIVLMAPFGRGVREAVERTAAEAGLSIEPVLLQDLRMDRVVFFDNFGSSDIFLLRLLLTPPFRRDAKTLTDYFKAQEASNLARGLDRVFPAGQFINRPTTALAASSKPLQLRVAAQVGLTVPDTLISTTAGAARAFVADLANRGARAISKPIDTTVAPNPDDPDDTLLLFTREVTPDELENAEPDHSFGSPVIFQQLVEKAHELRVVMFGDRARAIAIDSQRHENSSIDWRWRQSDSELFSYVEIDPNLQTKLRSYLDAMDLDSGVFDIAVGKDGTPYFLECNAHGQWEGTDAKLGGRIGKSFAQYLVDRVLNLRHQ